MDDTEKDPAQAIPDVRCRLPEDMQRLGAAVARWAQPGDVIALAGDLGAGKTCFVQGFARELGVRTRVTSPTFVIVKTHDGRIPVVHVDVYRLQNLRDLRDLGDEVFEDDVVTLVEWADAVAGALPADHLEVAISIGDDADDGTVPRTVRLVPRGRCVERGASLQGTLAANAPGSPPTP